MKKQFAKQKTKFKTSLRCFLFLLLFGSIRISSQTGAAIKLDGTGDWINLGSALSTSLNGGSAITIEAWVNTTTNSGGHGPVIGNYNTNTIGGLVFLLRRENGHHVFWVGNNGSIYPTVSLNTSIVNVWTHLACVWNGSVATIYVNGVQTASTSPAMATLQSTVNNHVFIGAAPQTNEYFNGMIDEVRIWNVARTRCQINTYKNCEIPNNAPGLLANYHFNQGVAGGSNIAVTTLTDATSSALTGTLAGITLTGTASNWVAAGAVVSGSTTAVAGPSYSASSLSTCAGNTISLTSTGATTFTWFPTISNAAAFTPAASLGYTIISTNGVTSCSNTAVANVTVNPSPIIVVNSGTICNGSSFTMLPSGANSYTFEGGGAVKTPTASTSYTVVGTSLSGCVSSSFATSNVNVSLCTGLSESLHEDIAINIFPNPTSTYLTVQTNHEVQIVYIYNCLGDLVQSEKSNSFSVEQLPLGIYILMINTTKGISIGRFIKD